MNRIIEWMAHNHVAANLLMLLFIVGGLVMGAGIKQEVFPEIEMDMVRVEVAYPGAAPEEVEEGIILKIEENLSGLTGVKNIDSTAAEGMGSVLVEIEEGEDTDEVLQDINSEIDRITTFPEDAESPVVTKLINRHEVISVVVYGDLSMRSLRQAAENIRDDLLLNPGITQADLLGVRPYEISIDIPEDNLRLLDMTLQQVAARVSEASRDIAGGEIKTRDKDILIRTIERKYAGFEYEDITLAHTESGSELKLGDVGTVRDTFRETDEYSTFDGQPAAMVAVYRVGDQKPTELSGIVHDYVREKRSVLPDTVNLAIWNDMSEILESRINLLLKNAFLGLILVFIILGLFLQIKLAMLVMLTIPISFLGAMLFLPGLGVSINMVSLFAFILALGLVVDNAIVIGENTFEKRSANMPYRQAAVQGSSEVAGPIIFSVLTTVAAFLPLLTVTGMMGKFMFSVPAVVISILMISLVQSLFILPAHLSVGRPGQDKLAVQRFFSRIRGGTGQALAWIVSGPYTSTLSWSLKNRYTTLACSLALLMLTAGFIGSGTIKFNFMPEVDGDLITASLEMPPGTPASETSRWTEYLAEKAEQAAVSFDEQNSDESSILRHVYSVVGNRISQGGPGGEGVSPGGNIAEVALSLVPAEQREIHTSRVTDVWRDLSGQIPGAMSLTFSSSLTRFGAGIDIQLEHDSFDVLSSAAARLRKELDTYPGVSDIRDSLIPGKQELKLTLRPEARSLGLTEEDLGRQVRAAFYGAEALRLQRGRNEVRVYVRYPPDERQSIYNLENLRLRNSQGADSPLSLAANIEEGRGFSVINRSDRKRVVNVTAEVDPAQANAREILQTLRQGLLAEILRDNPGISYDLEGEQKETRESFSGIVQGFILALFLIFALLAIPFKSYAQPLIIMMAIPFGIVGAVAGHLIMGINLSMMSLFGIVALAGVVVNSSLLLIDLTNKNVRSGMDVLQAVTASGQRRFRPILLTSLTTFFGLSPMILETSLQARFLIPMAVSLGFGILFATGITLVLIPSLYLILEDLKTVLGFESRKQNEQF
ncbi:MAG: efflux RND transporter permease subunit [Desulfonatronovibrio sp.]